MKLVLKKRLKSFVYAYRGIRLLFVREANARIHLVLLLLVIVAGFYFNISSLEWIAVVIVSGMVFLAEAINTALEVFLDAHHPEKNKFTGQVKDLAAGAVLLAAITAAIVGVVIFFPKIFTL